MSSSEETTLIAKSRRRWYQFRLRTLLILAALSTIPFSWLGREVERGRRAHEALAWAKEMGAQVTIVNEAEPGTWATWWQELFGLDVRQFSLPPDAHLSDVSPLIAFRNLEVLFLSYDNHRL